MNNRDSSVAPEKVFDNDDVIYPHSAREREGVWAEEEVRRFLNEDLEEKEEESPENDANEGLDTCLLTKVREHTKQYERQYHYAECAALFYASLKKCKNKSDVAQSFLILAKMLLPGSLITTVMHSDLFTQRMNNISSLQEEQSAEEAFGKADTLFTSFREFQKTELYKRVYKLYVYILTYSVFSELGLSFDNLGYTQFEKEAMRRKCHGKPQFVMVALETFVLLFKKGFQIMRTGRLDPIFHNADTYAEWFDKAHELKLQSKYLANPEANGFDEFKFRRELDHALDKGMCILKCLDQHDRSLGFVKALYKDLLSIKFDVSMKQDAKAPRKEPFAILINGSSGIGKSLIKEILIYHFFLVKGRIYDAAQIFTRNPVAKYWDGFTTSQNVVVLDDIAFMHPNKASEGDPSCMEFLQIINSVPYVPDQAALEDKGRAPLKAELVIGTTNTKDLNLHYYFQCPTAAQRRFPYVVTPILKPEFKGNTGILEAPIQEPGKYQNCWVWRVERPHVVEGNSRGQASTFELIAEFDEVNDFLDWYASALMQFENKQSEVAQSLENMRKVTVCDSCKMLNCLCENQSEVIRTTINWLSYLFIIWQMCKFVYDCGEAILVYLVKRFFGILWLQVLREIELRKRRMQRWLLAKQGEAIAKGITPQRVIVFAVGVFAVYKLYKLYSQFEDQSSKEVGKRPVPMGEEPTNVWYKDDYTLTPYNVTRFSASTAHMERATFIKNVQRDIVRVEMAYTEDGECHLARFNMVCLRGKKYIANAHSFECFARGIDFATINVLTQIARDGITSNIAFNIRGDNIRFVDSHDLCIIDLPEMPSKKGVFKYIGRGVQKAGNPCFYLTRGSDMGIDTNVVCGVHPSKVDGRPYWNGRVENLTYKGDSGSPLFMESPCGFILIGIHASGNPVTQNVRATYIDASYFEQLESEIIGGDIQRPDGVGDLHKKSVFRYIDSGRCHVYGSFQQLRVGGKSRVGPTLCRDFFLARGYTVNAFTPNLRSYVPWRIAALDLVNPNYNYDPYVMNVAINGYLHDILNTKIDLKDVHPYDQFTAINGAAGVAYVDRINCSTSAGYPYRRSKKYYLDYLPPEGELLDPVEVTPEVQERIDSMYETYCRGERVNPIFIAHLKDEPVSSSKLARGKVRVFAGAPFDWSILVRKYFLPMIRLIQNNPAIFECAVGITAQSTQWDELYKYLTHHGPTTIVAGDFAAFDKQMCLLAMDGAFEILIHIAKISGNYTEEDLKVMRGIKQDTIQPFMDYNGDLVQFFATNPSGHPLTVILNSMVNCIYMRYVYFVLHPLKTVVDFQSNVNLSTYGDDNIMNISKSITWFNHTSISEAFNDISIEYTMPDKDSESVPYLHILDASYLKRKWIYNEHLGKMVCPLDHASINRTLTTWVSSKTVCPEEQMRDILLTVAREYFWYGKETFLDKRNMLMECWKTHLSHWAPDITLPTFDSLVNEYWIASRSKSTFVRSQYSIDGYEVQCEIVSAAITDENFEDIYNFPRWSTVGNYTLPWQLTNWYFVYIMTYFNAFMLTFCYFKVWPFIHEVFLHVYMDNVTVFCKYRYYMLCAVVSCVCFSIYMTLCTPIFLALVYIRRALK